MSRWKFWTLGTAAVIIDLTVYAFLGVMMMGYDDFHDGTEPDYHKWASLRIRA